MNSPPKKLPSCCSWAVDLSSTFGLRRRLLNYTFMLCFNAYVWILSFITDPCDDCDANAFCNKKNGRKCECKEGYCGDGNKCERKELLCLYSQWNQGWYSNTIIISYCNLFYFRSAERLKNNDHFCYCYRFWFWCFFQSNPILALLVIKMPCARTKRCVNVKPASKETAHTVKVRTKKPLPCFQLYSFSFCEQITSFPIKSYNIILHNW